MTLINLALSIRTNLQPYIIKIFIDHITINSTDIYLILCIYIITRFSNVGIWGFSDWLNVKFHGKLKIHIMSNYFGKISDYSYKFFQDNLTGNITSKVNDIFSITTEIIFTFFYQFVQFIVTSSITFYLLYRVNFLFSLGLFVTMIIFLLLIYFTSSKIEILSKNLSESKSNILGYIADYVTNILNVKLFSSFDLEQEKFRILSEDVIKRTSAQALFYIKLYSFKGILVTFWELFFLILLTYLKQQNLISLGDFILVLMLNISMIDFLFNMSHSVRSFINDIGTLNQALSLLKKSSRNIR